MKKLSFLLSFLFILLSVNAYSDEEKEVSKTFDAKDLVEFELVSGDCIIKKGESSFTTASGSVYIRLSESLAYDTKLTSASGNATLDYNGNNISGTFEFVARVKKGEIISPIKFDKEEIFTKNGKEYYRKSFTKGNKTPEIKIETSTGKAELLK